MQTRPPIIVILGHVDHGKSTLIDHIRKTNLVAREAGGITQAIGAYEIVRKDKTFTFIDTPGHEAFSLMRKCGAEVADIAILLVAADDGVMPQTKEALDCIKKTNTPFIVAINKIDVAGANVEKTKSDLAQNGVYLEGMGGDISWQGISAKTGEGVEELLDLLALAAEVEELTCDPNANAEGIVLTSMQDARSGIQVGVVIKNGTLKQSNLIKTETAEGKIRFLKNFKGETVRELKPSAPALISGFASLPNPGELFAAGDDITKLKEKIATKERAKSGEGRNHDSENGKVLRLVLKADETGSLEALKGVVAKIGKEKENLRVIETGVGNITENDIKAAVSGKAAVVGFNVKIDKAAKNLAAGQNVLVVTENVIYELEKIIQSYLKEVLREPTGILEVLAIFGERKGKEQIIGGRVVVGKVVNQSAFEIQRESDKIGEGKIQNLQIKKEDAREVKEGQECGMLVESSILIVVGHKLLFFE
ncbi:MAG: GTP-binding protein [bacterium]|nr:GTP-binding protein [bacterium]